MDTRHKILYNFIMEKKIIGVYINFLTPDREKLIADAADKYGYKVRFIEHGTVTASDIEDCEILFGQIPPDMLKYAQKLKWLHCAFAGVDKYLNEGIYPSCDVILSNSSGAYGTTIAEHIICVLLMLMRHIPTYGKMTKERVWQKIDKIDSICESKIVVVGVGDIGESFGRRAKAMGAEIVGIRKNAQNKPDWCDEVYSIDELICVVSDCDAVVSSLPKTKETDNLFNVDFFANMKQGSYFVNVGRGNSVDEEALSDALKSGHLAGGALDVFKEEPLPKESFLYDTPNLIITPHCAGDTALSLTCDKIIQIFTQNLALYAAGKQLLTKVDRKSGY